MTKFMILGLLISLYVIPLTAAEFINNTSKNITIYNVRFRGGFDAIGRSAMPSIPFGIKAGEKYSNRYVTDCRAQISNVYGAYAIENEEQEYILEHLRKETSISFVEIEGKVKVFESREIMPGVGIDFDI